MFFTRFWKPLAAGVTILAAVVLWQVHNHRLVEKGKAQERSRVADSTLKVVVPERIKVETLLVHDIVTVNSLASRLRVDTLWRKDTVYIAGDTTKRLAVPVATVVRNDSLNRACSELTLDCASFRKFATAEMAALRTKLATQPQAQPRSCAVPETVAGVLGVALGAVAGHAVWRP